MNGQATDAQIAQAQKTVRSWGLCGDLLEEGICIRPADDGHLHGARHVMAEAIREEILGNWLVGEQTVWVGHVPEMAEHVADAVVSHLHHEGFAVIERGAVPDWLVESDRSPSGAVPMHRGGMCGHCGTVVDGTLARCCSDPDHWWLCEPCAELLWESQGRHCPLPSDRIHRPE